MGCIFVQSEELGSVIEFQAQKILSGCSERAGTYFYFSPVGGNLWAQCHTAGQGRVWPCAPVSAARSGMWAKDPATLWIACELCHLLRIPKKCYKGGTTELLNAVFCMVG